MTLGDVKIQTYQPAHWERGRERKLRWWLGYEMYRIGLFFDFTPCRMTGNGKKMDVMELIGRIQTHWCGRVAVSHRDITHCILTTCFLHFVFSHWNWLNLVAPVKNQEYLWGTVCVCVRVNVHFLTYGSRAAVAWRWGCRQPASSAGETASRFWSPASGHSLGRSYVQGSPCTRCALTPGSPDQHKGKKRQRGTAEIWTRG